MASTVAVDGGEIAEDGGGIHVAGAEFFFHNRQIRPHIAKVKHPHLPARSVI